MKVKELDDLGKPYKIYAEVLEQGAIDQFVSAMHMDFTVQGAMMPDAHPGYALPIGAVVATKDVIIPAWVGYDIGCGMLALPTSFDAYEVRENSKAIFDEIYSKVPVGFNAHEEFQDSPNLFASDLTPLGQGAFDKRKGFRNLGTLGGGNHFIEIGVGTDERTWIIVHSGSRGVGHGIATEYMRLASPDGKPREDHFGFNIMSKEGSDYYQDMSWALKFALLNRTRIAKAVEKVMAKIIVGEGDWNHLINRNHNHAEITGGTIVHRKGATHAEKGMSGVIPGNMRDGSFIVEGKGNPESLYSSSHGAGRVLGRKQAKRELSMEDFKATMQGTQARVVKDTLDESPFAYKDINEVMHLQEDLVKTLHHVHPIINIKG